MLQESGKDGGKITGTASFCERLALLPGVVFEAKLEDVSRADTKAELMGATRIENAGSPPYRFEIEYDRQRIDERHAYAVRAMLRLGDRLLFTTETVHPVLTRGGGVSVELMLKRVPSR